MPATSLSLSRKKVPPSPSLCHLLRGVDVDGEFSSVVIFFISIFSQHLFTVKLLFNWPCQPPSLSLSRQQEHATTIHVLLVAWGRQWRWVFLLFLFFLHCSNLFLTAFFLVKFFFSRPRCHRPSVSQVNKVPPSPSLRSLWCGEDGDS